MEFCLANVDLVMNYVPIGYRSTMVGCWQDPMAVISWITAMVSNVKIWTVQWNFANNSKVLHLNKKTYPQNFGQIFTTLLVIRIFDQLINDRFSLSGTENVCVKLSLKVQSTTVLTNSITFFFFDVIESVRNKHFSLYTAHFIMRKLLDPDIWGGEHW